MAVKSPLVAAVVLSALMLAGQVHAYPGYFVTGTSGTPSCGLEGPIEARGPHLAPVVDKNITFTITKLGGGLVKVTDKLAPGDSYKVTATWVGPKQALLTASIGKFAEHSWPTCALAVATTTPTKPGPPTTTVTATWSVPCGVQSGKVTFAVTHSHPGVNFYTGSTSLTFSKAATSPLCSVVQAVPGKNGTNSSGSSNRSVATSSAGRRRSLFRKAARAAAKLF